MHFIFAHSVMFIEIAKRQGKFLSHDLCDSAEIVCGRPEIF